VLYRFVQAAAVGVIIAVIGIAAMAVRLIGRRTQALTERTRVLLGFAVAPLAASCCYDAISWLMNLGSFINDVLTDPIALVEYRILGQLLGSCIWTLAFGVPAHLALRFLGKRGAEWYRLTGMLIGAVPVVVIVPIEYEPVFFPQDLTLGRVLVTDAVIAAACGLAAAQAFWWIAVSPRSPRHERMGP